LKDFYSGFDKLTDELKEDILVWLEKLAELGKNYKKRNLGKELYEIEFQLPESNVYGSIIFYFERDTIYLTSLYKKIKSNDMPDEKQIDIALKEREKRIRIK
jgi:hypothetical protein